MLCSVAWCKPGQDSIPCGKVRAPALTRRRTLEDFCVIQLTYLVGVCTVRKESACWAAVQVETAEVQLDVIEEGIDELCNLEKYLARTHPPYESAELLAVRTPTIRRRQNPPTQENPSLSMIVITSYSIGKPSVPHQHVRSS